VAPALDIASLTDPGRARSINCDRCAVADRPALADRADAFLMVVDGMGANRRGDTASLVASEVVPQAVCDALGAFEAPPSRDALAAALRGAVAAANLAVWRRAQDDSDLRGMGTTCVAAIVADGTALLCHAGDSRGYLLADGTLTQVTADHSLIQEVVPSEELGVGVEARFGTVVSRGIGLSRTVEADLEVVPLGPRDALLLCTDGLTNMVRDRRIAEVLARAASAQEACANLVADANAAGGMDNIGVAVCRGAEFEPYTPAIVDAGAEDAGRSEVRSGRSRRRRSRCGWSVPVIAVLAVVCAALAFYVYAAGTVVSRLKDELARCQDRSVETDRTGGRK